MSLHRTQAIVLNRRDFRETSLIVNFYSSDFGKLSGILKGIRKEPEKFASSVEPFSYNEIIFYKKRNSSLHLVSQCDLKDNFDAIRQDITRVGLTSMIMELLDLLMPPEDKNADIFNLALSTLGELSVNNNPEKIATIFKIKILGFSGFKPQLDSCVCCENKILGEAKFSLSLGGLICSSCNRRDTNARSIFRGTIATILHIEKNDLKANLNLGINPDIKRELDLILNSFLNFHLEKDLKSEKVLQRLREEI
jgi:DNA repair protein RecO (recombination protein O)